MIGFRESKSKNNTWNVIKTFLQSSVFWATTLVFFPSLIVVYLHPHVSNLFHFTPQIILGIVLFCLFSVLGVYSGYIMSTVGKGTPLPLDCAQKLVVKGPYRFVRNPMAVAGISQAIAVGIYLGSYLVIIYALLGALFWHIAVRPLEEKDLLQRFEKDYASYKDSIWCWIPKFKS